MSINLINTLAQPLKTAAKFVNHNEQASGLSTGRFLQDAGTCLVPKAVFARSKADLAENTFLELSENFLVYFAPALIGENIARKAFQKGLSPEAKKLVGESTEKLMNMKTPLAKKVLSIKAAIALCALFIPLTEFTLNYIKNLMTLKIFKKGNFNNIANLDKSNEDSQQQEKVKKSAVKNIKKAVGIFAACVGLSILVAKKGTSSKFIQNLSELILQPGTKLFPKNQKAENFLNKYFSLDHNVEKGKLVLSKGQLTSCVLIGGAGYFGAAKDRGKQNFLETLFRFPIVGLYIITGSEPFEKRFKQLLKKAGKCKEVLGENLEVPTFDKLEEIAKQIAKKNNTQVKDEFKKLAKQKVLIFGIPYILSIGIMGFFVAGISNLFTKYRYNMEKKQTKIQNEFLNQKNTSNTFKQFFQ